MDTPYIQRKMFNFSNSVNTGQNKPKKHYVKILIGQYNLNSKLFPKTEHHAGFKCGTRKSR